MTREKEQVHLARSRRRARLCLLATVIVGTFTLGSLAPACSAPAKDSSSVVEPPKPTADSAEPVAEIAGETNLDTERALAIGVLFGAEWSRWLVEINTLSKNPRRPIPPSWLAKSVRHALHAVFVAAESASQQTDIDAPIFDDLSAKVAILNRKLAAEQIRFTVDPIFLPTVDRVSVLLFTFTLDRLVHYIGADGAAVEISWVKRFDTVAYRYRLLGFTGPGRQPVVLLGPIDDWLITELLTTAGSTQATESASARASTQLAARLALAVGKIAGDSGKHLALLVARRHAVFAAINRRLEKTGAALRAPRSIAIKWNWRRDLVEVATTEEMEELELVQSELMGVAVGAAINKLRVAVARATEGHELQHQLDGGQALDEARVASFVTGQTGRALNSEQRQWMAGEVSALLAEIARADGATTLSLARQVMIASGRRSLEQIAARAVLRLLSNDSISRLDPSREADSAALLAMPIATLQRRARDHWATMFGHRLKTPTRKLVWSAPR